MSDLDDTARAPAAGGLAEFARALADLVDSGATPLHRLEWHEVGSAVHPGESLRDLGVFVATGIAVTPDGASRELYAAGSGLSADQRVVSAVLEVAERVATFGSAADLRASYESINDSAIDPRTMSLHTPEALDEGVVSYDQAAVVDWTRVTSLATGRAALIHRPVRGSGRGFYRVTTNGQAAGRGMRDATTRGLFELIERDAVMLHWYGRLPARRLSPAPGEPPDVARVWLAAQGFEVQAFDLTTDIHVPVSFAVATQLREGSVFPRGGVVTGAAAARTSGLALTSALLEIVQTVEVLLLHVGGGGSLADAEPHVAFYASADRRAEFEFLDGHGSPETDEVRRAATATALERAPVDALVSALAAARLEPWVVDRTPTWLAPLGIAVAETFVPGLQPLCLALSGRNSRSPSLRLQQLMETFHGASLPPLTRCPQPLG